MIQLERGQIPIILDMCIVDMSSAFVFLNCDIGAEREVIHEMNEISGVSGTARVSGIYDIVAKVSQESKESMLKLVRKIRGIDNVRSCLTMIVAE